MQAGVVDGKTGVQRKSIVIRFAETEPKFEPGEIVRHRRYHYRGVVASVDLRCQADHDWYVANQTQPEQNQPWYHVLVDGSATTTYAAEANLEADSNGDPVDHPLLSNYFDDFCEGKYVRNDRPWKGW